MLKIANNDLYLPERILIKVAALPTYISVKRQVYSKQIVAYSLNKPRKLRIALFLDTDADATPTRRHTDATSMPC